MAMPGTRTQVADLCMFGFAACDGGGPRFINASVRTVTNARQVGMRMQRKYTGKHRHARVGAINASEKVEQPGTWAREVPRTMEEQLREGRAGVVGVETEEDSKGCKEDARNCS